ncbi:Dimethylmenaquinone methyltransferase [Paraburkholderia tropica]|uniref:RraA family protein n=1 Tax=Paraburkholderia TaxID=1822464 RepID=UPI001CAD13B0|nr:MULTISPECIES: RraA family protein [Paraburkholderia]CAG9211953.1 Dimethylmenaquinone methyltransferase [Paraburkholderia tropica]
MELQALISGFEKVATASVADAVDLIAGRRGFMDQTIKPRINERKIVGPAVTILEAPTHEKVPPQHALDAIDESPEGSVIVIGIYGEQNVAVWGGLMTAGAVANRHAGAILDGGVRDITEIRRDYDFPVYSRSVSPGTTVGRFTTLAANIEVECGGVKVNPGDIIVADIDGVVVVPREHAEAVLKMSEEIDARELEQARLIIGEKSLRKGLAKYGRI